MKDIPPTTKGISSLLKLSPPAVCQTMTKTRPPTMKRMIDHVNWHFIKHCCDLTALTTIVGVGFAYLPALVTLYAGLAGGIYYTILIINDLQSKGKKKR
jgi:hypothetical protein